MASRLSRLRLRIAAALTRAGDPGRRLTLVAVSKGYPASAIEEAASLGLLDIGENRVLEALKKAEGVLAPVRWHMIGHLQRNKVGRAVRLFTTIHSCDSVRLIEALGETRQPLDLFLEVNTSGEKRKQGVTPEGAIALWRAALRFPALRPLGLMAMAPYDEDPEAARPTFRALRELRDRLNQTGEGPPLQCLSMGMSGDFETALEEGATHLRIGTALMGEITDSKG